MSDKYSELVLVQATIDGVYTYLYRYICAYGDDLLYEIDKKKNENSMSGFESVCLRNELIVRVRTRKTGERWWSNNCMNVVIFAQKIFVYFFL